MRSEYLLKLIIKRIYELDELYVVNETCRDFTQLLKNTRCEPMNFLVSILLMLIIDMILSENHEIRVKNMVTGCVNIILTELCHLM